MDGEADIIGGITRAFAFLTEDLGFELADSHEGQRESHVRYVSATTRVTVHADHMPLRAFTAVALFRPGSQRRLVDEFGLAEVVREQDPEEADRLVNDVDTFDEALARQAGALQRHAADLLLGERNRLPRLKRAQAARTRRRNKEEWGTSTGESPRFDSRPSLKDLFADANNDGLNTARAYQAFWDYDYPLAEIAAFLDETEAQVQARLDDWDGL